MSVLCLFLLMVVSWQVVVITPFLWDVNTGQPRAMLEGHESSVRSISFSPDGSILASGSDNVKLWDVNTGQLKATLRHGDYGNYVRSVSFSPDGSILASGGYKTVKLWDVNTGQLKATLTGYIFSVTSVSFSPDGSTLASGSDGNTVRLWDVNTGQLKAILKGMKEWCPFRVFFARW